MIELLIVCQLLSINPPAADILAHGWTIHEITPSTPSVAGHFTVSKLVSSPGHEPFPLGCHNPKVTTTPAPTP